MYVSNEKLCIISYPDMNPGGIQKSIYNYFKMYLQNSVDCIWMTKENASVDEGFLEVIGQVRRMTYEPSEEDIEYINAHNQIVSVSFSLLSFERTKRVLRFHPNAKHLYLIPHFDNVELFPELLFSKGAKRQKVFSIARDIYQNYYENRQVYFYQKKHGETLWQHYGLHDNEVEGFVCKRIKRCEELNLEDIKKKADFADFNIISVCRFEFPHKGYVLGLIRMLPELVRSCPNVSLTIVGYGDDEPNVLEAIRELPEELRKRVELVGKVSYPMLKDYYCRAMMSINLAGSAGDAVSFGVPTLVARHYTCECEVYGLYQDSLDRIVSDEPGNPALPFIRQIYERDFDSYLALAQESHACYKTLMERDLHELWMFDVSTGDYVAEKANVEVIAKALKRWTRNYRLGLLRKNPRLFFKKLIRKIKG